MKSIVNNNCCTVYKLVSPFPPGIASDMWMYPPHSSLYTCCRSLTSCYYYMINLYVPWLKYLDSHSLLTCWEDDEAERTVLTTIAGLQTQLTRLGGAVCASSHSHFLEKDKFQLLSSSGEGKKILPPPRSLWGEGLLPKICKPRQ